jgi:hypothetical protein
LLEIDRERERERFDRGSIGKKIVQSKRRSEAEEAV